MSDRYPGGLIRKTPPTITPPVDGEGGSAPGIWTLEQASYYQGIGEWPKKTLPRQAYGWGENQYGQIGLVNDTVYSRSSPVQVGAQNDWSSMASGRYHTLFIRSPGELYAVGRNNSQGQIGDGTQINRSSPVQIGALTTWSQVSAGSLMSAAIKTDGSLWTWGFGTNARLGHNDVISRSSPTQVGALTDWASVSAGDGCLAVKTDGTLWAWGYGLFAILAQNNTINYSSPVQIGALTNWSVASLGKTHGMAVKTDGTLWGWGFNTPEGFIGDGTTIGRSSPVQIGSLTNWSTVNAGRKFTAAIKTDGSLWAWGDGSDGKLGNNLAGSAATQSSPIQVGALTNWLDVECGQYSSISTKTDGTLWTWGAGFFGNPGQNNNTDYSSPVQVGSSTDWSSLGRLASDSNVRHAIEKVTS